MRTPTGARRSSCAASETSVLIPLVPQVRRDERRTVHSNPFCPDPPRCLPDVEELQWGERPRSTNKNSLFVEQGVEVVVKGQVVQGPAGTSLVEGKLPAEALILKPFEVREADESIGGIVACRFSGIRRRGRWKQGPSSVRPEEPERPRGMGAPGAAGPTGGLSSSITLAQENVIGLGPECPRRD